MMTAFRKHWKGRAFSRVYYNNSISHSTHSGGLWNAVGCVVYDSIATVGHRSRLGMNERSESKLTVVENYDIWHFHKSKLGDTRTATRNEFMRHWLCCSCSCHCNGLRRSACLNCSHSEIFNRTPFVFNMISYLSIRINSNFFVGLVHRVIHSGQSVMNRMMPQWSLQLWTFEYLKRRRIQHSLFMEFNLTLRWKC